MSDLINRSMLLDSLIYCQGLGRKSCELVAATINNQPIISEQEIRDKAIEDFVDKLKEKCNFMIAERWNSEVAPMYWANAYADFKDDVDDIAEQMKNQ